VVFWVLTAWNRIGGYHNFRRTSVNTCKIKTYNPEEHNRRLETNDLRRDGLTVVTVFVPPLVRVKFHYLHVFTGRTLVATWCRSTETMSCNVAIPV
jgi:hypothetical protein